MASMFDELPVEHKIEALRRVCSKWFSGFPERLDDEAQVMISEVFGAPDSSSAANTNYNPYAPLDNIPPVASPQPPPAVPPEGIKIVDPAAATEPGVTKFGVPDTMPPTGGAVETPQEKMIRLTEQLKNAQSTQNWADVSRISMELQAVTQEAGQ